MSLHVSVCPWGGEEYLGRWAPGKHPPRKHKPPRSRPLEAHPREAHPPPHPGRWLTLRRYASYWNAFLFLIKAHHDLCDSTICIPFVKHWTVPVLLIASRRKFVLQWQCLLGTGDLVLVAFKKYIHLHVVKTC